MVLSFVLSGVFSPDFKCLKVRFLLCPELKMLCDSLNILVESCNVRLNVVQSEVFEYRQSVSLDFMLKYFHIFKYSHQIMLCKV